MQRSWGPLNWPRWKFYQNYIAHFSVVRTLTRAWLHWQTWSRHPRENQTINSWIRWTLEVSPLSLEVNHLELPSNLTVSRQQIFGNFYFTKGSNPAGRIDCKAKHFQFGHEEPMTGWVISLADVRVAKVCQSAFQKFKVHYGFDGRSRNYKCGLYEPWWPSDSASPLTWRQWWWDR